MSDNQNEINHLPEGEPAPQRYTLKDVLKNRKRLKRTLAENSLFSYIIFDYWKIRKYGAQNGLIESAFLIRLKISPGLGEKLERNLNQEVVIPLAARLDVILAKAWLHLNKWEYNLIALLRSVCTESERIAYVKLNASPRFSNEAFRFLEPHFLVFYRQAKLVKKLLEILQYAHESMESVKFSYRETRQLVERLLLFDAQRPSLAQAVLAANMVSSKRFLGMADLIEVVDEPVISELDYDVDEKTHAEIYSYMDELDRKLANVYSNYTQMNGLRFFMPRLDPQTPDIGLLQKFITGKSGPERKGAYSEMYANIPSYVIDFTNTWIGTFETTLCRQPLVEQQGPVQFFSPAMFSDYFSRLKFNLDQIERMRTQLPFFQILRYLELTKKSKRASSFVEQPNKMEGQLLTFLDDNVRIFRSLKDELHRLCVVFSHPPERWDAELIETSDTRGLPTGNQAIIQYAGRRLLADGWTNGMIVSEAMRNAIALINLYLYELHEGNVLAELEDEAKLRTSIKSLIHTASRLGNREQVQRFERKYPLDQEQS